MDLITEKARSGAIRCNCRSAVLYVVLRSESPLSIVFKAGLKRKG